jgi:V-type H+-transporting ATPase subunit B
LGKDTQSLKAVVGEEALSPEEFLYLDFLERFEKGFVSQGPYENRDIFTSLDMAWDMLRIFPPHALKKIDDSIKNEFYYRGGAQKEAPAAEAKAE